MARLRFCVAAMSLFLAAADKLAPQQGDPARVSVSGLSSGAFMAVQYEVAFSASTMGVGVVAGGPYNCAFVTAGGIVACMSGLPLPPIGASSQLAAYGFANLGQIDPVANIAAARVYLFSGKDDTTVETAVVDATRDFFVGMGVAKKNLLYVHTFPAGHAFISTNEGNACGVTQTPFVNACTTKGAPYDQPEAILTQIYGTLAPKAVTLSSQPVSFDQAEFAPALSGMSGTGYVYVPKSCQGGGVKCAVHVVFHGCMQGAGEVGDAVYGKLGYNEWADANNIMVLYPQVDPGVLPPNPQGCWDWWGYSGLNFQVQSGKQLTAVHAMVRRLTGQ